MDRRIWLVITFCFFLLWFAHSGQAALNLALGKTYTLSAPPNYSLTAPPTDRVSLTDGKYTSGQFWKQKTTVGWKDSGIVEILIDLGGIRTIDGISFSTARGNHADVHFPTQVYAFAGDDPDHLSYLGDIAKSPDNVPGTYLTKRFTLEGLMVRGKYVLLEVVPKGHYFFCDEIEITEGSKEGREPGTLTIAQARKWPDFPYSIKLIKNLGENPEYKAGLSPQVLNKLKQQAMDPGIKNSPEELERELLREKAALLQKRNPGKPFVVSPLDPWGSFSPLSLPLKPGKPLFLGLPQNGSGYGAFAVTNLAKKVMPFSIGLPKPPEKQIEIRLYQVPLVKNTDMEYIADPLVPVAGLIELNPGETRMILMAASGHGTGKWNAPLTVSNGQSSVSLACEVEVYPVSFSGAWSLNALNWAYPNQPAMKKIRETVVQDLLAHHLNVFVVPPEQMPRLSGGNVPNDLIKLKEYLDLHKGMSKVLLFMGYNLEFYREAGPGIAYLDNQWKVKFRGWFKEVLNTLAESGFSPEQVYLYPFDEIQVGEADLLIRLVSWIRSEMPKAKIYSTIGEAKALPLVQPYLDVTQIDPSNTPAQTGNKSELWIYSAAGPAKALSPYGYYRLMAWNAFVSGFKGIGFWNYSDFSGWGKYPGGGWDEIAIRNDTYAVVYEGKAGEIISSRRWESWKMGIEDFELLTLYAKEKGRNASLELARYVLANSDDVLRADEMRLKIMKELAALRRNQGKL